jgi:hypothetical protein
MEKRSVGVIVFRVVVLVAVLLSPLPAMAQPAAAVKASETPLASAVIASKDVRTLHVDKAMKGVAALQTTNTLYLRVISARTEPRALGGAGVVKGDPVTEYKFIINVDDTGDPTQGRVPDCSPTDPSYPANCTWPSIRAAPGHSPIVTQGDHTILNEGAGLTLPDGKYLISVLAPEFKIDGVHLTVPLPEPGLVEVEVQPYPLPTATIRIKVFEDSTPTNGQPDMPAEPGLAGFTAHLFDVGGETTTDAFGNPLCTQYEVDEFGQIILDPEGLPIPIPGTGGACVSDANGDIVIPNVGPNRWAVSCTPPPGTDWIQTTTLEGSHDWDTWLQEGGTGFDTEFAVAGEPFPFTIFGYVLPTALPSNPAITGEVKGVVAAAKVYVPLGGGLPYPGEIWGGLSGTKIDHVIPDAWIALSSIGLGDTAVYVGKANPDGTFHITNVPDGSYILGYWDEPQNYILDIAPVTVANGEVVDLGVIVLTGWFTRIYGSVFVDSNENGKRDPGERGVSDYLVTLRRRENSLLDRGSVAMMTDGMGMYMLEQAYPLTRWLVLEAYNERYRSTGITYQADNQPTETTVLGDGVDVGVLPIIGQSARVDWGVKPYEPGTNGGIAGTVVYDTTRNELNPRYAAAEDWQPGIPGLTVNLYATVKDVAGNFELEADGSYKKGPLLNTTVTESWERPKDCQARDVEGNPVDQEVLPPSTGGYDCLEAPLMGIQVQTGFAPVDGNYGLTTIMTDPVTGAPLPEEMPIPPGDYLVEVVIPNDAWGRPLYKVTKEEDINVFGGDQLVPQVPPPACCGPLHTVDVLGIPPDGPNAVDNPSFRDEGGSPYEGMDKPLCNMKLVTVSSGRSIAPIFYLFTDVPIPGRFFGYIVDDLNLSTNPQDLLFGEKAGVANSPIGLYDYTNRLVATIQSDPNGVFEVLLPSTYSINYPSPSGVSANLYRLVGNDPGVPGRLNPNYNPQFRTIAAIFEVFPGLIVPADLAPTQIGVSIQGPGSQFSHPVSCALDEATPQLFAVSRPFVNGSGPFTITGLGFGATQGTGKATLDNIVLPVTAWTDRQIDVSVPVGTWPGMYQLAITADNGQSTVNGLTFHVGGPGYAPTVFQVGPGKPYATIQSALDAAASTPEAVVLVWPGQPDPDPLYNPRGAYYENIIIHSPVKLQGVGPGGVYPEATYVPGSIIDGAAFGGDTALAEAWRLKVAGMTWVGNQNISEGQVVYVLAEQTDQFTADFKASIDGFTIRGGDQQGFPNNINQIGGVPTGLPPQAETQGGGIFVNAYVRHLQITNNILESNGGSYGGAIRVGTPDLVGPEKDNQNDNIRIVRNRILANGGTNLAGGVGIFAGAENYEVAYNDICGCFSAEYGGGISHYGLSPNGKIHHNRIYFNRSYDEGGGVMIAGELPADPASLSPGSGPVEIYNNIVQGNLANDDGGGVRLLMAGDFPIDVYNNFIVNNVSTHEGGGIALDDAPDVRVYNNTIMKNMTTATATTSDGSPLPAGLTTVANSAALQASLPPDAPIFSNPLLFNNIFWDNRAGTWTGGGVAGLGLAGDPNPIHLWDLAVSDGSGVLAPTNSLLSVDNLPYILPHPSNKVGVDPTVMAEYDTSVWVFPWRTNPNFVGALLVAVEAPPNLMGDYHIPNTSAAVDTGRRVKDGISAPAFDIDDDSRPSPRRFEAGADEVAGPAVVFPKTPVLDDFNRADGGVGGNWVGSTDPITGAFRIRGNEVQVFDSGTMIWNAPGSNFGAAQEAYFTLVKPAPTADRQGVILKFNGTSPEAPDASLIEVAYDATTSQVRIRTLAPAQGWVERAVFNGISFSPGDVFGAGALRANVGAFKNGVLLGSTNVRFGANPWPAALAGAGGQIGVVFAAPSFDEPNEARFDDFGGGTRP